MKRPKRDWKEAFREGLYVCPELRVRRLHRDLLAYLVYRANHRIRLCWASQAELATVLHCSVRNIRDLLGYLAEIGAIFPVSFSEVPPRKQKVIVDLTPGKETRNAKVYYICEGWAQDQISAGPIGSDTEATDMPISPEARAQGREKANSRRRRKAPFPSFDERVMDTDPAFDEWQILNAGIVRTGSPTSAPKSVRTGSPTTDRTIDNNPAATSAIDPVASRSGSDLAPSQANHLTTSNSAQASHGIKTVPHGYGGGAAVALGSKAAGFGLSGGPRPEGTEQDAARAHERRAL